MYDTDLSQSTTFQADIERAAQRAIESFVGTIDEAGEYLAPIYQGAASMPAPALTRAPSADGRAFTSSSPTVQIKICLTPTIAPFRAKFGKQGGRTANNPVADPYAGQSSRSIKACERTRELLLQLPSNPRFYGPPGSCPALCMAEIKSWLRVAG